MWLLLLACSSPDPRIQLAAELPARPNVQADAQQALRWDQPGVACSVAWNKVKITPQDTEAWSVLLRASSRSTGCLPAATAQAISDQAASGEGSRAEWLAFQGKSEEAQALALKGDADSRMRVYLRLGMGEQALSAAEEVLAKAPDTLSACRLVAGHSYQQGNWAVAMEEARCAGMSVLPPDLRRLQAKLLDQVGERAEAEAIYRESHAELHLAAMLYQEHPSKERIQEALSLVQDPAPPAAMHRAWMALLGFRPQTPDLADALGLEPAAQAALALLRYEQSSSELVEQLKRYPGAFPVVVAARILSAKGQKEAAMAMLQEVALREPFLEVAWRARIGVMKELNMDMAPLLKGWQALDPDHLRLRGDALDRDQPWEAAVPWSWEDLKKRIPNSILDPAGSDEVGQAWRALVQLPDRNRRLDMMEELAEKNPGLDGLSRIRYRVQEGLPPDPNNLLDVQLPIQ